MCEIGVEHQNTAIVKHMLSNCFEFEAIDNHPTCQFAFRGIFKILQIVFGYSYLSQTDIERAVHQIILKFLRVKGVIDAEYNQNRDSFLFI